MNDSKLNIAVLGCTGSIGCNTLAVADALKDRVRVVGMSAHSNLDLLFEQAKRVDPDWIVATSLDHWRDSSNEPVATEYGIHVGAEHLEMLVQQESVDCVVAAIVGSAGLASTLAAVKAGKRIALANKETLVLAGSLVTRLARESAAEIIPVDSEHSAVFQAIRGSQHTEVEKIVLTASGGPFREWSPSRLKQATVEQALAHPTWQMGRKITIDSATMMNKALEIIEARWLFDIPVEKLAIMIHPQSIVHSMVEFVDGSVLAQLSPPDMKLPIQYALTFPERVAGPADRIDWEQAACYEFQPPDLARFPALELGFEVARNGGTAGAVVNAANEAAVEAFLNHEIGFTDIVQASREVLNHHKFEADPSLQQLLEADRWARQEIAKWILA